ncbi:MAG: DUF4399 domain-containing protein [Steroidobacteraceae bacterium]
MDWKIATLMLLAGPALASDLPRSPAPPGVELYFISPQDGATLANPVTVRFGLKGMGIAPAGIALANTGHHHLLIDTELPPLDRPVPADAQHIHFGKGQTETTLTFAPGRHRLQLLLGDHLHRPHEPVIVSLPIEINVRR